MIPPMEIMATWRGLRDALSRGTSFVKVSPLAVSEVSVMRYLRGTFRGYVAMSALRLQHQTSSSALFADN
jgi:hypothetical protein